MNIQKTKRLSINVNAEEALVSILECTTFHSIILHDSEGRILQVNEGTRRMYGYNIEELIYKHIRLFFTESDIAKGLLKGVISTTLKEGRWDGVVDQVKKDGAVFSGHMSITQHIGDEGEIKGYVTIIKDMTDRINLENKLRDDAENLEKTVQTRTKELQESEAHYRELVENSPEMIHQLDKDGRFLHVNKTELEKLGYTVNEIMKRRITDLIPENYLKEVSTFLANLKKAGKSTLESYFITKSGKEIPVEIDATAFFDPETNNIKYSISFTRDMSEKHKLMDQILHQERMASIGLLSAGVAHEIGNPLTSISAITQIMQRKLNDEFALKNLNLIRNHIDRINKIVRELVTFSRPVKQKSNPTNINKVINSAIEIIKFDHRSKFVEIRTSFPETIPIIMIVEDQLLQVLINLIYNAIDAVECQPNPQINIDSTFDLNMITIKIQDNGTGIPRENLKQIFDPFFTTKEVGKGTGLGLSVSYSIIKNFGGEIKVFSIENKGSTFTVSLPLKKEND